MEGELLLVTARDERRQGDERAAATSQAGAGPGGAPRVLGEKLLKVGVRSVAPVMARSTCSAPSTSRRTASPASKRSEEYGGASGSSPSTSWAGTTPGNNESAGKVKSSRTRPGNPYLQGALGAAAMACSQNRRTYLGARYRRIASRRGPMKANVAIQHSMLIAIWHVGMTGTLYEDPGAEFFTRLHPDPAKKRAIGQLEAMGYKVTLDHAS